MAFRFRYSALKTTLAVAALAAAYVLFVMGNRWFDDRRATEKIRTDMERKKELPPELATEEMKILQFYGSPPVVKAGQQALLCYGVINARSARIDPEIGDTTPALTRCVAVTPKRTTRYVMTAEDSKGRKVTAELELKVQ